MSTLSTRRKREQGKRMTQKQDASTTTRYVALKKYLGHRPEGIDEFYLQPIDSPKENIWYKKLPEMFPDNKDEEIYQALSTSTRGFQQPFIWFKRYVSLPVPECLLNCVASLGYLIAAWYATGLSVPPPHDRLGGKGKTLGIFKPFLGKTRMLRPPFIKS